MNYTVISDLEVCGKTKGEVITDEEFVEAGANLDALINAGHIEANSASTPASKEGEK